MKTVHHAYMLLALRIAQEEKRHVALLVPYKASKATGLKHYVAIDLSDKQRGHTAVVNLVQNVSEKHGSDALENPLIYLTCPPSNADRGIFIEQVKGVSPRLIYLSPQGDTLIIERPSKLATTNIKGSVAFSAEGVGAFLDPVANGVVDGQIPGDAIGKFTISNESDPLKKGEQEGFMRALLSLDDECDIDYSRKAVQVPHATPWVSVPKPLPYEKLSKEGQFLFDQLFMLLAYSLASPTGVYLDVTDLEKRDRAKVGCVIASNTGEMLSWGVDFSSMLHGEVSTLKQYQERYPTQAFPPLTRFYTSLEPCFMCSGLITAYEDSKGLTVIYGQVDQAVRYANVKNDRTEAAPTFLKKHKSIEEVEAQAAYHKMSEALQGKAPSGAFSKKLVDKQGELHGLQLVKQLKGKELVALEDDENPTTLELLRQGGQPNIALSDKNMIQNSVMVVMDVRAYARRLAKAKLQLILLIDPILGMRDGDEGRHLLRLWNNVMFFLVWSTNATRSQIVTDAITYLKRTQGKNVYKMGKKEYDERERTDYDELAVLLATKLKLGAEMVKKVL